MLAQGCPGAVILNLPSLFSLAPLEKPAHLLRHCLHGVQSLTRHQPSITAAEQEIGHGKCAFFFNTVLHLRQNIRTVGTEALPASFVMLD